MYSKFFKAVDRRREQALTEKYETPNANTVPFSDRTGTETENLTETMEKSLIISKSETVQSATFDSNQSGNGNDLVLMPSVISKIGIDECTSKVPLKNSTKGTATSPEKGSGGKSPRKSRVCFMKTSSQSIETKMCSGHPELGDSVTSCVSDQIETVPNSLIKSTENVSQESKQIENEQINLMHMEAMEINLSISSEIQCEDKEGMENSSQQSKGRTGGAKMNMKELRKKLLDRLSKSRLVLDGNERDKVSDSSSHKSDERIVSVKTNIMDIEKNQLDRLSKSPLIPGEDEKNRDSKEEFAVTKTNIMDITKNRVDGMFKSPVSRTEDEQGGEYFTSTGCVFVDAEGNENDSEKNLTCSRNEKVTNESDEHLVTSKPLSICKVNPGDMDILNNSPCESKSLGACKKMVPFDLKKSKIVRRLDLSPVVQTTNTNGEYQSIEQPPNNILSKEERRIPSKDLVKRDSEIKRLTNKSKPLIEHNVSQSEKNAVSALNEIKPNLKYVFKISGPAHTPLIEAKVDIDGSEYLAYGNSKKEAKINVANMVLCRIARSRRKIAENAVSTLNSEVNPVSVLNNMCQGLHYQFVEKFGPAHLPTFRFQVEYDGKVYYGSGHSKQAAKADTASNVLKSFNRTSSHSTASTISAGAKHASVITKSADAKYLTATAKSDSQKFTTTSTDSAKYPTLLNAKDKNPFAILNKLFPNPQVSEILRDLNGNASFSIAIDGRKFTEVGPNLKSAKNRAAIKALYEMTGVRPDDWENY